MGSNRHQIYKLASPGPKLTPRQCPSFPTLFLNPVLTNLHREQPYIVIPTALILYKTMPGNLPLFRDPWAKREAWRNTSPVFSNRVMFRNFFPGFGIAVVAFTAYVAVDNFYLSKSKSHDSSHDSHHH